MAAHELGHINGGHLARRGIEARNATGALALGVLLAIALYRQVVEVDPEGDGEFAVVGSQDDTPLGQWSEASFAPVTTSVLRVRATAGEAGGKRAYPVFGAIQVIGQPPCQIDKALELGHHFCV